MVILSSAVLPMVANAQENGQRRGPPPEAIDACSSQIEAAVCSFTSPRGDVTGSCMVSPKGEDQLICMPEGGPPQKP